MNAWERILLTKIAGMKQGRVSYSLLERERAMEIAGRLVEQGYIRERRLGFDPGFQITDLGKAYVHGVAE